MSLNWWLYDSTFTISNYFFSLVGLFTTNVGGIGELFNIDDCMVVALVESEVDGLLVEHQFVGCRYGHYM